MIIEEKEKLVKGRGWILAALMMTMMLAAMDSTIISTAVPHIVSDLGGFSKFSWVFSIYLLAQTVTIPLYGKFADLFGRKSILVFGIIVFLLGSFVCAAAWNMSSLIVFRAIQGIGAGSIMANVNTIAGDIYTVKERARIQGYLSSIWGISAILGPALGGALSVYFHWRWIFLINLPIGIVSLLLIIHFFKEKLEVSSTKVDYKGATLILITLSLFFVFLLEGGQSWAWISPISLVLILAVLILAYLTYHSANNNDHAIMPLWIWRNKTLAFTNLAMVGMGIVMMGPEIYLPTFAQTSLSLNTILSGFILTSMSFGWPVASAYSGRLYLNIGFRNTSIIGAVIIFIAIIWFLLIPYPQATYMLILNQILIGAGFGLLSTPSLVGMQSMVTWERRGVVTSSNIFSRNLGQSVGAAIVGAIFNNSLAWQIKSMPYSFTEKSMDILTTLKSSVIDSEAKDFLQKAISNAMHHIYWGMAIFTILILLSLFFVPRKETSINRN